MVPDLYNLRVTWIPRCILTAWIFGTKITLSELYNSGTSTEVTHWMQHQNRHASNSVTHTFLKHHLNRQEEELTKFEEHSLPRWFRNNSCAVRVKVVLNKVALGPISHAEYHTNNLWITNSLLTRNMLSLVTENTEVNEHIAGEWRRFAILTRWNSVHLQVLLSATPQGGMFPEVSHPQALLGSLVSISWKFHFTKVVSEFVINF